MSSFSRLENFPLVSPGAGRSEGGDAPAWRDRLRLTIRVTIHRLCHQLRITRERTAGGRLPSLRLLSRLLKSVKFRGLLVHDPRRISDSAVLIASLARRLTLLADFIERPHAGLDPLTGLHTDGLDAALVESAAPRDWAMAHAVVVLRHTDLNDWAHEFTTVPDVLQPLLTAVRGLDPESLLAVVYACPPHIRGNVLCLDHSGAWGSEPADLPAAMGTVAEFAVEPLVPTNISGGPDPDPDAVLAVFAEGGPDAVRDYLTNYTEENA